MKVTLINHTPDPERTVAAAARLCYSPLGAEEILDNFSQEKAEEFLKILVDMGHMSPTEHVTFTFAIEGISRVLTHQMVRHRIGVSFSQKSQRYVREDQFEYITPPSIARNPVAKQIFEDKMRDIQAAYQELAKYVAPEDARYVLPNATETKLVVTFNVRSLYHFFQLRCCVRAQWEIRRLAQMMLAEVRKVAPVLFAKAGATCESHNICFEGKMSCGKTTNIQTRS